jgi:hypothetical protein
MQLLLVWGSLGEGMPGLGSAAPALVEQDGSSMAETSLN